LRGWTAQRIAAASGATPRADAGSGDGQGPSGVAIDSRQLVGGELFVGLPGERTDGGAHAAQALAAGAWGVLVSPPHADAALAAAGERPVLVHADPLAALQSLAAAWRAELRAGGARVLAITGSTGKTSTKDILAALLRNSSPPAPTAATPANLNTEIGLPLAILAAPAGTKFLVLEMAMRARGQIAQLTAIADPDVGVIVNVGPAHLEMLGSLEAIAAAKAELIAGLAPGRSAVVPAGEELLRAHLREDVRTITFGDGGEVRLADRDANGRVRITRGSDQIELWPSFSETHNISNLLAAVAAAGAVGVEPAGALEVSFSASRGAVLAGAGGVVVVDDCYNANPMSMRAAIDELAETPAQRRVAVLGDMLELGSGARPLHREVGEHAGARGVDLVVAVGELAGEIADAFPGPSVRARDAREAAGLLPGLLREGDTVLVKGSRGVGLERVVAALTEAAPATGPGRR
jgi:UDP-N-acetylmuramoyl-tripeptide--D-alanyl-D-alanine ligase